MVCDLSPSVDRERRGNNQRKHEGMKEKILVSSKWGGRREKVMGGFPAYSGGKFRSGHIFVDDK